jgi:hypothetical protein
MTIPFREAVNGLDEASFQALYGPSDPLTPEQISDLLAGCGARWIVAGGRAARVGAQPRRHADTDISIRVADVGLIREVLRDWHLWEANDGALKPLLPGVALSPECEQLWVRRAAGQPWRFEFLFDLHSTDDDWVYKRDPRVRLPWQRAVHTVGAVVYLRPELALLFKAKNDRPKDRADLLAARLDPVVRDWLADTLDQLGQREWARLTRSAETADCDAGATEAAAGATELID